MEQPINQNELSFSSYRTKIGNSIKQHRKKAGYSQEDLAELMKVNRSTISKIENGKFSITIDYLEKLSFYLNFDIVLNQKISDK